MRLLFLDCEQSGISGDLLLSGLAAITNTKEIQSYLEKILSHLDHIKEFRVAFESKISHGIKGLYLQLQLTESIHEEGHSSKSLKGEKIETVPRKDKSQKKEKETILFENDFNHDHIKTNHQSSSDKSEDSHTHYDIKELQEDLEYALEVGRLRPISRDYARNVLNILIDAEATMHGIPTNQVHFHELGAADTLLDIAGTTYLLETLGVFDDQDFTQVFFSPIAVGRGSIQTAHGILPVPAPATAAILEKYHLKFFHGPVDTELATPTGVSLLAGLQALNRATQENLTIPYWAEKIGIGVGTKELPDRPNILRIYLGKSSYKERDTKRVSLQETEPIFVLETNIDDISGEQMGYVMEKLFEAKALDVSFIPCTTKKNRPGIIIKIIASKDLVEKLTRILIEETGTLGVRINEEVRVRLPREITEKEVIVQGKKFQVRVKVARMPDGAIVQEKFEFEDLKRIAGELKLPLRAIEQILKKENKGENT